MLIKIMPSLKMKARNSAKAEKEVSTHTLEENRYFDTPSNGGEKERPTLDMRTHNDQPQGGR